MIKNKLKKHSIREYQKSDFRQVCSKFLAFQLKNEISSMANLNKNKNESFYRLFLVDEFKKILKKTHKRFVVIDEETGTLCGFASFNVMNEKESLLFFCFKDEDYAFNHLFKRALLDCFKLVGGEKIYANLSPRDRFDQYIKFVQRIIGFKHIEKQPFGRVLVAYKNEKD